MIIRPSDPESHRGPAALRRETPVQSSGVDREPAPVPREGPQSDRSELSEAARGLVAGTGADLERPALAPGRLRAVAARLRTGHYDQADVLLEVAQRILAEWTGERREA